MSSLLTIRVAIRDCPQMKATENVHDSLAMCARVRVCECASARVRVCVCACAWLIMKRSLV